MWGSVGWGCGGRRDDGEKAIAQGLRGNEEGGYRIKVDERVGLGGGLRVMGTGAGSGAGREWGGGRGGQRGDGEVGDLGNDLRTFGRRLGGAAGTCERRGGPSRGWKTAKKMALICILRTSLGSVRADCWRFWC